LFIIDLLIYFLINILIYQAISDIIISEIKIKNKLQIISKQKLCIMLLHNKYKIERGDTIGII